MPKASKAAFYAVHRGRQTGVYTSWADCDQQTNEYPKAVFKKFSTEMDAKAFVERGFASGPVAAAAGGKSDTLSPQKCPGAPRTGDRTTYMAKKLGKQKVHEDDIVDESGWDVVFTDGACQGNGQVGAVAGIGVWWGVDDPRSVDQQRCPGDQTNNRAELIAIIRALETAPQSTKPLLIKTDSSYSISCIRDWIPSWRRRGWKTADGNDVKNKAVIVYLSDLLDKRGLLGQKVQLQHVRGHAGVVGNEGADVLAGMGVSMPATPERDWSFSQGGHSTGEGTAVDFQVEKGDLLTSEELNRMLLDGEI